MRLAREGMKVVINSRTPETVETTTAELRDLGADVLAVPADVGHTEDVDKLFDATLQAYGTVDLLVNNAANLHRVHFFELDEALLDNELASNIRGPFVCTYRAATVMRDSGGGNIINISSVGGLRAHWRGLPYDVTKGALDAMTRAMSLELAEHGIRVNGIAPGPIDTWKRLPAKYSKWREAASQRVPLARFGTPLEIGSAVAFLASSDTACITGQTIYVDGGITTQLGPRGQPI